MKKKQLSFDINLPDNDRERVLQKLLEETGYIETDFDEAKRALILEIFFRLAHLKKTRCPLECRKKEDEHDRKYVIKIHGRSWQA